MPIPLEAIRALVAYNWASEQRDYEEREHDGDSQEGHVFTHLQAIDAWLATNPPEVVRILTVRDPDYENVHTTEGEIETYDIDLGSSFNGPKDFDADSDWGREWLEQHRAAVAHLSEDSPIRQAVEELCDQLEKGQR